MAYNKQVYKKDLLYPKLSYQIVGILFDVFKDMGYGYKKKQYQKAIGLALDDVDIEYKNELSARVKYKNKYLTTIYLNFLIEDKIILELK